MVFMGKLTMQRNDNSDVGMEISCEHKQSDDVGCDVCVYISKTRTNLETRYRSIVAPRNIISGADCKGAASPPDRRLAS